MTIKLKDFIQAIDVEAEIVDIIVYDYETESFCNIAGFEYSDLSKELESSLVDEDKKYLEYGVAHIRCSNLNHKTYMVIELEAENEN